MDRSQRAAPFLADHLRLGVDHRGTPCLLVALAFVAVTVGRAT